MARKRYTKEFKQQAVQLVLSRSHTAADAARELGCRRERCSRGCGVPGIGVTAQ